MTTVATTATKTLWAPEELAELPILVIGVADDVVVPHPHSRQHSTTSE